MQVLLLITSVTGNYYQTNVSVHGHDMFSARVWDPMFFKFAV